MNLFRRITLALALVASPLASSEAAVKTFLPKAVTGSIADPTFTLPPIDPLKNAQIDSLASFIRSHGKDLRAEGPLSLRLVGQALVGNDRYVRFKQVVRFKVANREVLVPIEGASVVAVISNGRLVSLNSSLVAPATLGIGTKHAGMKFVFSDAEMARFVGLLKTHEQARGLAKNLFESIARRSNQTFDLDTFLNRELAEQKVSIDRFFANLGAIGTTRLLLDMAAKNQVAFVRYGDQWAMQLDGLFGLPIQFDVMAPSRATDMLLVKNLREVRTRATEIRGYESPHFPGGKKVEGGDHATRAVARLNQINSYFAEKFGWTSYKGQGTEAKIEVHTQLKSIDYRENASWIGSMQKFIVGEGGQHLAHIDDSLSVLGHEYAHAIIQFSSGLTYRGQSGALNEHFADIQGATLDATLTNGGKFRFTIGEEILTPAVRAEKEKLLDLILSGQKYSSLDVVRFGLQKIGLRHLYAPALSFATQIDGMAEYRKLYPESCQPSIDNDNCGVHTASGIPNKAASLIIESLGLDETRSLFFNTLVYRLNPNSDFRDYLVQLLEECAKTPSIASRCDVITASFGAVGVSLSKSNEFSTSVPFPISVSANTATPVTATLVTTRAATPPVKLCGWVDKANEDRIRIYDAKYDATILSRNHDVKTQGDVSKLAQLSCACVKGRLTQTTNARGQMINAFLDFSEVEDRGSACEAEPRLKNLRPSPIADRMDQRLDPSTSHTFCGWVSVNSASKNVTVIDNKYDVVLLASGYSNLTQGDFQDVYRNQCACVHGKIAQLANSKGTIFNYFVTVEGTRVTPRDPALCSGIEWK